MLQKTFTPPHGLRRRNVLAAMTTAAASIALPAWAGLPDKTIRVVVPWPAGGVVDVTARLTFADVQNRLKQTFVIDNKLGAGGAIGANAVATATNDGSTLGVTTSALCINKALNIPNALHPTQDFAPIALLATAPGILVVSPNSGIKTIDDLVNRARQAPGRITFASAGNGSPAHLAAEWFKTAFDLDMVHVAYKGGPAAMMAQISGLVDFQFANAAVALPQIKAGKVIPIAVGSSRPLPYLPKVPTMQSAGIANFDSDQWVGVLGPAGLPSDVADLLAQNIAQVLRLPSVQAGMAKSGIVPAPQEAAGAAAFTQWVANDLARWVQVVQKAQIKLT